MRQLLACVAADLLWFGEFTIFRRKHQCEADSDVLSEDKKAKIRFGNGFLSALVGLWPDGRGIQGEEVGGWAALGL